MGEAVHFDVLDMFKGMVPKVLMVLMSGVVGLGVWIFNNVNERVDNNVTALVKLQGDFEMVRGEQLRRSEVISQIKGDVGVLRSDVEKVRVDLRSLYEFVVRGDKVGEDVYRELKERQIVGFGRIERVEERVVRLEGLVKMLDGVVRVMQVPPQGRIEGKRYLPVPEERSVGENERDY